MMMMIVLMIEMMIVMMIEKRNLYRLLTTIICSM